MIQLRKLRRELIEVLIEECFADCNDLDSLVLPFNYHQLCSMCVHTSLFTVLLTVSRCMYRRSITRFYISFKWDFKHLLWLQTINRVYGVSVEIWISQKESVWFERVSEKRCFMCPSFIRLVNFRIPCNFGSKIKLNFKLITAISVGSHNSSFVDYFLIVFLLQAIIRLTLIFIFAIISITFALFLLLPFFAWNTNFKMCDFLVYVHWFVCLFFPPNSICFQIYIKYMAYFYNIQFNRFYLFSSFHLTFLLSIFKYNLTGDFLVWGIWGWKVAKTVVEYFGWDQWIFLDNFFLLFIIWFLFGLFILKFVHFMLNIAKSIYINSRRFIGNQNLLSSLLNLCIFHININIDLFSWAMISINRRFIFICLFHLRVCVWVLINYGTNWFHLVIWYVVLVLVVWALNSGVLYNWNQSSSSSSSSFLSHLINRILLRFFFFYSVH